MKSFLGRTGIFLAAAGIHVLLLLFLVLRFDRILPEPEPPLTVMKLTDIREAPPPPPGAPPVRQTEAVAENLIATRELPPPAPVPGTAIPSRPNTEPDYLPMHQISVSPSFSEEEIRRRLVYPSIAQRSGLEGMVYLELFIDPQGNVQRITILKEDPQGRGFGEAAVKAFQGLRGSPAEANGVPVAVRFRYPVRFRLKG
ncbi:MAG: TonB family protein [Treponema sp.]|nr:TonB family protein [Treponema sp.]